MEISNYKVFHHIWIYHKYIFTKCIHAYDIRNLTFNMQISNNCICKNVVSAKTSFLSMQKYHMPISIFYIINYYYAREIHMCTKRYAQFRCQIQPCFLEYHLSFNRQWTSKSFKHSDVWKYKNCTCEVHV